MIAELLRLVLLFDVTLYVNSDSRDVGRAFTSDEPDEALVIR